MASPRPWRLWTTLVLGIALGYGLALWRLEAPAPGRAAPTDPPRPRPAPKSPPAAKRPPARRPNIVLMLADNLGYGELGCYGGGILRGAPTPRIDALAAQGVRFLNFNVESDCVPTRSALMTGRHPIRTGAIQSIPAGLPQGLIPWEITLAQLLSKQGYATAAFGKWHLGDRESRLPTSRGFDERY